MRTLLACFFLFAFVTGYSQLPARYRITRFTGSNGIPEEPANSVVQDSRGFLWMATQEALIRFDGLGRKTWYADPSDSTRFFNSNINVVGEYKKGRLLFLSGTELWEANIYNLQLQQVPTYKKKKIITKPITAGNGYWIISTEDSLFITNRELQPVYTFNKAAFFSSPGQVSAFYLKFPYLLLHGGLNSKMLLLNLVNRQVTDLFISDQMLDPRARFLIPQAFDSSRNRLYLSSYFDGNFYTDLSFSGKQRYDPVRITTLPDGAIRKSLLLKDGTMILGGDNHLYITDFSKTKVLNREHDGSTGEGLGIITDISPGNQSDFWIASTKGISLLSLHTATVSFIRDELSFDTDDEFKSILKTPDNNIYFLTQQRSLFQFDRAQGRVRRIDSTLAYCWSAAIKGNTIEASGGGRRLLQYDLTSRRIRYPDFLRSFYNENTDLVTLVFQSRNGDSWYSCNGSAGLIRNPAGSSRYEQFSRNSSSRKISLHYAHTAAEDSRGNIWFASNKSSVLLHWNAQLAAFEELSVGSLLPAYPFNTGINHLYIDPLDHLWISLDAAALLRYNLKTKTGVYYDINKGLPSNTISGMTHDARNRIWFTSSRGLCCYFPEKEKIAVFTRSNGFPEDQFDGKGILYDQKDNLLYVAGRRTLSWFKPDALLEVSSGAIPTVYVDEITVNNHRYYFGDEKTIRLGVQENNIEFSFSVPDFIRNNQLVFEYRLGGSKANWISLGNKRTVSFFNLSHGKYEFTVRCRYPESENWSETSVPVSFTIQTPWHKTWWFILLLSAAGIAISLLVIRFYYHRKLEKQQAIMEKEVAIEQERTKMARELHDGLGSMLSGIKHSFSAMNRDLSLGKEQQHLFQLNLDKLNDSIIELRNISHNRASDALLKYGLENSLRDYCNNTSIAGGIPIHFTAIHTEQLKLDEDKSFHIFRILQELLQNIIKHANARQVLVQISANNNVLYMTVEDDGIGFNLQEAWRQQSLGLKNIATRVKLLKGQLDYKTHPGEGTSVLITLPVP